MTSQRHDSRCPACGHEALPWLTTCARCDRPLVGGSTPDLPGRPATALDGAIDWVDIPIPADQPVEVALLCYFLSDHGVGYEASRRFVSVPADDAVVLVPEIEIWAFDHDLPDDDRHSDSLAATQRRIGRIVLEAIETSTGHRLERDRSPRIPAAVEVLVRADGRAAGLDLRPTD